MTLKVPISSEDHMIGNPNLPITLVEYGDYECSHCREAHYIVKEIVDQFNKHLRYIFRHFPLTQTHTHAEMAAEAAEFAASKNRFWEMHDLIFENQEQLPLGIPFLLELGEIVNLPMKELNDSIVNGNFESKIKKDVLGGIKSGVNSTPTFYINNKKFNGSPKDLAATIDSFLIKNK